MRSLFWFLAGFGIAACLVDKSPAAPASTQLGVNIHFTHPRPGEMDMLAAAGFRWVRMDFDWAGTEREKGVYDFSAYDHLMAELRPRQMRAVFILDYGNRLYGPDRAVVTPEAKAALARWAAAAVTHFKGQGIVWEIWNEPNGGFWKPVANVQEYSAMALEACKAMRAVAPIANASKNSDQDLALPSDAIIGPATSTIDFAFLEACFKAGLLDYWDAVSVHPYRQGPPESVTLEYRRLRLLIQRYAPAGRAIPIISGEWGYSSAWQNENPQRQSRMLARELLVNLAENISLSIWYDWHEDGSDPKEEEHHFGTVGFEYHSGQVPVYAPKPAYAAAHALGTNIGDGQFLKRLSTPNADDYVLLFGQGHERMVLAAWTTGAGEHSITYFTGARHCHRVSMLGEPAGDEPLNEGKITLHLTEDPSYWVLDAYDEMIASTPAAHPLHFTIVPVPGKQVSLRIENLSDEPFSGVLHLSPGRGLQGAVDEIPVELPVSVIEKTFDFPLKEVPSEECEAVLTLRQKDGFSQYLLPTVHYRWSSPELLKHCHIGAEGDAKVSSQQSLSLAAPPQPLPGGSPAATLKVTYSLQPGWKYLPIYADGAEWQKIAGRPRAIGWWIYSDGQSLSPRTRIVDAQGRTWQPSGETLAAKGWRYIECPFDTSTAHWGGPKDANLAWDIPLPLHWNAFLLLDNPGRKQLSGEVYCTPPVLIY